LAPGRERIEGRNNIELSQQNKQGNSEIIEGNVIDFSGQEITK